MIALPPIRPGFPFSHELQAALEIVVPGCRLLERIAHDRDHFWRTHKEGGSLLTIADVTGQAFMGQGLLRRFSEDAFIAEEGASGSLLTEPVIHNILGYIRGFDLKARIEDVYGWIVRGKGELTDRTWVADPLDFTSSYVHGGEYAVNLAFLYQGKPVITVNGFPRSHLFRNKEHRPGYLMIAAAGEGCWYRQLEGRPYYVQLQVSRRAGRFAIPILPPQTSLRKYSMEDLALVQGMSRVFGASQEPRIAGGPMRYPLIASGQADVSFVPPLSYYESKEWIWDHLGVLGVLEAGGGGTDCLGHDFDWSTAPLLSNNHGILLSNGRLHKRAVEVYHDFYERIYRRRPT